VGVGVGVAFGDGVRLGEALVAGGGGRPADRRTEGDAPRTDQDESDGRSRCDPRLRVSADRGQDAAGDAGAGVAAQTGARLIRFVHPGMLPGLSELRHRARLPRNRARPAYGTADTR